MLPHSFNLIGLLFLSAFLISSWSNLVCKLYVLDYRFLISLFLNEEKKIFTGVYCYEYCGRKKTIANKIFIALTTSFVVLEVEFSSKSAIRLFLLSPLSLTYFYRVFIKPITLFELIVLELICEKCHPVEEITDITLSNLSELILLSSDISPYTLYDLNIKEYLCLYYLIKIL